MTKKNKEIVYLVRQYYRIQEHRIAFGNQIYAIQKEGEDTNPLDVYYKKLYAIEKEIASYLKKTIKDEEIWNEFLKKIKGIGPVLASALINLINIEKARHISSLWKYAGLTPDSKRKRGEKANYNPLMKTTCWKIGKSFLMKKSQYRVFYEQRKKYEEEKHPELSKLHIHNRSMRYMVKRFLADLWLKWRELRGLPIGKPYVVDKLGHSFEEPLVD